MEVVTNQGDTPQQNQGAGSNAEANAGASVNEKANLTDEQKAKQDADPNLTLQPEKPKLSFVDTYGQKNSLNLTDEEIEVMKSFTREQIEQLARKYPNTGTGRPYLLLYDTRKDVNKQIYPRSTWANLAALLKMGQTHYRPFTFANRFNKQASASVKVGPVQDLTKEEARAELGAGKTLSQKAISGAAGVKSVPVGQPQLAAEVEAPPTKANLDKRGGNTRAAGLPGSSAINKGNKGATTTKKAVAAVVKGNAGKSGNKK